MFSLSPLVRERRSRSTNNCQMCLIFLTWKHSFIGLKTVLRIYVSIASFVLWRSSLITAPLTYWKILARRFPCVSGMWTCRWCGTAYIKIIALGISSKRFVKLRCGRASLPSWRFTLSYLVDWLHLCILGFSSVWKVGASLEAYQNYGDRDSLYIPRPYKRHHLAVGLAFALSATLLISKT